MNTLSVLEPICCVSDARPLGREAAEELATIFKALADPTRVSIVNRLASTEECCVCDFTQAFEISQPTVSHHLRILREAGLVEAERRGTWAYYRLAPGAIERLRDVFSPTGRRRMSPAAGGSLRLRPQRRPQPDGSRALTERSQRRVHVRSAGTQPAEEINPVVVQAMDEIGIDLGEAAPKP